MRKWVPISISICTPPQDLKLSNQIFTDKTDVFVCSPFPFTTRLGKRTSRVKELVQGSRNRNWCQCAGLFSPLFYFLCKTFCSHSVHASFCTFHSTSGNSFEADCVPLTSTNNESAEDKAYNYPSDPPSSIAPRSNSKAFFRHQPNFWLR